MKHMNEEITWEDALLQLEQVKDGRLPPKDTPTLANPLYARAYDKFLHHGTMTNDSTLRELYKLQTGNGNYIWNENLKKGQPLTILGHRVITSPAMPMIESGKVPILFGNFSFYTIGDRQHRRVKRLNEVYSQQGQVAYIMSQRVDAKLLDKDAIASLKVK